MREIPRLIVLFSGLLLGGLRAQTLDVLATIPDLKDLAERIGGARVSVKSVANGNEDIHLIPIRPSLLVKFSRADVLISIGMDLEHAWLPPLVQNSRNPKIAPGSQGFINCSQGIKALRIPSDKTRGGGTDQHINGNPHYNLDPEGIRIAARNIRDGLSLVRPEWKPDFDRGLAAFEAELDRKIAGWTEQMKPCRGMAILEHHDAWIYFAERYGIRIVERLEPKPGLAPTPSHLSRVVQVARSEKVRLVLAPPGKTDAAEKVASEVSAKAGFLPNSSTLDGDTAGWFAYMDKVVSTFAAAAR